MLERIKRIRKCFDAADELKMDQRKYKHEVQKLFDFLFSGDLPESDVSQQPSNFYQRKTEAVITAKSKGTAAGLEETRFILKTFGLITYSDFSDGMGVKPEDKILSIEGMASTILSVERTILNILQRLSGIATLTKKYVNLIQYPGCFIAATRKTLWGLPDKRAVQCGGGLSHRLNLSDALMLKENHLALLKKAGGLEGIRSSLQEALKSSPHLRFIEIEVTTEDEFWKTVKLLTSIKTNVPKAIMFDHFKPEIISLLISELKTHGLYDKIYLEASGNISEKTIPLYSESGVDVISVGSITHSAPSMDFSLTIQ